MAAKATSRRVDTVEAERLSPDDLMAQINAAYPGSMRKATDDTLVVKRWPTEVLPIDVLLDGGIARGRYIELFGAYSTLKSYVLYKALASVQKRGGRAALIDTEHSYDPEWGEALGIDNDTLIVSQPSTGEDAIGTLEILIRQRFDMVGFDSIAATIPRQYAQSAPGDDDQPAALARVMSRGLARITAANKHTAIVFINQTRSTIGVSFGPKSATSGGKAMGYYASARLSFTRIGKVTEPYKQWDGQTYTDAKRTTAHKILVTMEKSKLSAPQEETVFLFNLTGGTVDEANYLVAKGIDSGLITRSAAGHYAMPGVLEKAIHGQAKFFTWIGENPEVVEYLREAVMPEFIEAEAHG